MPILEVIIRQLSGAGFGDIVISVGYLGELLQAFVGDGGRFRTSIRYVAEDIPLGTAGALSLVPGLEESFLVINGDTLTTLNFQMFLETHARSGAAATIGTHRRKDQVDYGVLECGAGEELLRYVEKPVHSYRVSMGINALRRDVLRFLRDGEHKDMPQLMQDLVSAGERVLCNEPDCFWLDIGRVSDYEKAVEIFEERRADFLGGRE